MLDFCGEKVHHSLIPLPTEEDLLLLLSLVSARESIGSPAVFCKCSNRCLEFPECPTCMDGALAGGLRVLDQIVEQPTA